MAFESTLNLRWLVLAEDCADWGWIVRLHLARGYCRGNSGAGSLGSLQHNILCHGAAARHGDLQVLYRQLAARRFYGLDAVLVCASRSMVTTG